MSVSLPVLVLNASYEPIAVCTAKRAIKMWCKGTARVEETYARAFYRSLLLPSVVRLSEYRRVPLKKQTLSRRNVFLRDGYACQYCRSRQAPASLTLDHVIPKCRGGLSDWENLVTCCRPCNCRKGDRTPEEAGMKLATHPRAMNIHTHRSMMRALGETVPAWQKYLYF